MNNRHVEESENLPLSTTLRDIILMTLLIVCLGLLTLLALEIVS